MPTITTTTARILLLAALAAAAQQAAADSVFETPRHPIAAAVAAKLSDPATPFVLIVTFDVKPGQAEAFIRAASEPRRMTAKEAGNVAYELSRVAEAGSDSSGGPEFRLYERWVSIDALDKHLKQPYLVKFLSAIGGMLDTEPVLTVAVPVPLDEE